MDERPTIIVEFYGVPRQRAGVAEMTVQAGTVGEVAEIVNRQCPNMRDLMEENGQMSKRILFSLNGDEFVTDFSQQLRPGDRVILVTPDVGG